MADTPYNQDCVTDFLSWPEVVGARGVFVSIGSSFSRGTGRWLKEDARLTGERKMGYYAQDQGNYDYHYIFSDKAIRQVGHEAFRCCLTEC
jgi:hypothetical protein